MRKLIAVNCYRLLVFECMVCIGIESYVSPVGSSVPASARLGFSTGHIYNALLTALKKWTFDLSMCRSTSRRHIFEANVNGFTLVLQVHDAKPLDDLAEQASVGLG